MSRFQDYWKTAIQLDGPDREGLPTTGATPLPPHQAQFQGTTVWIHPGAVSGSLQTLLSDNGEVFTPDNAVTNVQFERYVRRDTAGATRTDFLRKSYYALKPLMPRAVQLALQRANARSRLKNVTYPQWPQDDSLRCLLHGALAVVLRHRGLRQVPFIGFWPRGYRWAACFTHDVETSAGFEVVEKMAAIEEGCGIRSTWFIVPERYPVPLETIHELNTRDHEVGVHGLNHDGRLFSTRREFLRRVPLIDEYLKSWGAVGFRSPALHRNPDWIPDLNIRYDSSFMDTAVLEPQFGGVSTVLPYLLADNVVELPITMPMDHHLINLLRTEVVTPMLSKFSWTVDRYGLANFLYHPDYNLTFSRLGDFDAVVQEVTGTQGGWIKPARDIADWWGRRHASTLVGDGKDLHVDGPAAPDAAIWYAHLEDDGVRIEVPS